jgi:outer membrane protein TolC
MANYLEVLRAQENELSAQLSYLNANYGRLIAVVDLYRALGGGAK